MDHIFLSSGSSWPEEDTVYYKGSTEYQKHTFLDFATEKGYSILLEAPSDTSENSKDYEILKDADRLDAFLQEWLFCSFLREVFEVVPGILSMTGMFEHGDFVRPVSPAPQPMTQSGERGSREQETADKGSRSEPRSWKLCTASLPELAIGWIEGIRANSKTSKPQYKHLSTCVSTIRTALKFLWVSHQSQKIDSKAVPDIKWDPKTISVIASTTDFIVTMILRAFEPAVVNKGPQIDQSSWSMFGWREIYVDRMVEMGWCRHEVASINLKFLDLPVMQFCTSMNRYTAHDHQKCTKEVCVARVGISVPKHRDECGVSAVRCNNFSIEGDSMSEMLDMIQCDELPVLKMWNHGNGLEVKMVSREEGEKYIALSHVWSDGMGNEGRNSLPRCQLAALHQKLSNLPHEWLQAPGNELLIWIDSLCCPLSPKKYRDKVLARLTDIYLEAEFVFVLDSELEAIDKQHMTDLEIAFRALNSNWMRRLWTLQEGYLAARLWVQFKGEAFELDQDAIMNLDLNSLSVEQFWMGRRVKTMYVALRKRLMERAVDRRIEGMRLTMAVQDRSVSKLSDEPLCIATLLGLDIGQIAAVEEKDGETDKEYAYKRMKKLWTLMEHSTLGIPKSILFYEGEKLTLDGFRWAPATFLKQSALPLTALYSASDTAAARISPHGLCVKSEGLLFPSDRRTLRCLQKQAKLSDIDLLRARIMYLRDEDGKWFIFGRQEKADQNAQPSQRSRVDDTQGRAIGKKVRYGVIFRDNVLDGPSSGSPSGIGLFVAVQGREDQTQLVTGIEKVLSAKAIPAQAEVWEIAYTIASEVRKSEGFQRVEERDFLRNIATDLPSLPSSDGQSVQPSSTSASSGSQTAPPVTPEETADAALIEEIATRLTRQQIADVGSIHDKLQRIGATVESLIGTVLFMVAGNFGVDVKFQSSDSVWCVD